MEKPCLLSGEELVAKGITKIGATLPEIGSKNVTPNGSWLEQKQLQASLEARKHLIEVERIQKRGALSQAEWCEDLQLAEVTQQNGGYWQYLGHHIGKKLYLEPEEALYLMEVNCLQIKYNEVTVSLQQAYSLLLNKNITMTQYRVYASLSRLGYKVFRHNGSKAYEKRKTNHTKENTAKIVNNGNKQNGCKEKISKNNTQDDTSDTRLLIVEDSTKKVFINENMEIISDPTAENNQTEIKTSKDPANNDKSTNDPESYISDTVIENNSETDYVVGQKETNSFEMEVVSQPEAGCSYSGNINQNDKEADTECGSNNKNSAEVNNRKSRKRNYQHLWDYKCKLQKLQIRQIKPCNTKKLQELFDNIPDLYQRDTVTIKAPEEAYIPKNIFLNNLNYVLNMNNIKTKDTNPTTMVSPPYSIMDEVNNASVRRIRSSNEPIQLDSSIPFAANAFPENVRHFRPYNFMRAPLNPNFFPFSVFYQRHFLHNFFTPPRFHFNLRPPPLFRHPNNTFFLNNTTNSTSNLGKREQENIKQTHLRNIKSLALKLKQLICSGNVQVHNVRALQRLLHAYNTRYKTRLRLTDHFDIFDDENVIQTIVLDDDEGTESKRPRLDDDDDKFKENLNKMRQMALKLKDLAEKGKVSTRHKRAFSNTIKTFNKAYNADVYLNSNYEVIDKRYIILDSSSDSDCVLEVVNTKKSKKLKNPFNILKQLSEKYHDSPSTSKHEDNIAFESQTPRDRRNSEFIHKIFDKKWLPDENDFGRAEIVSKHHLYTRLIDTVKDEYLYGFFKSEHNKFEDWLSLKISFLTHMEEEMLQNELRHIEEATTFQTSSQSVSTEDDSILKPILNHEDCTDIPSILYKLRIIKSNNDVNNETSLTVNFDVYERNVQNFRKTNPPKHHFRVVCVNETSTLPSGAEIATLYSKYTDDVAIMFAIVGVGSISYMRLSPTNLPVYVPNEGIR